MNFIIQKLKSKHTSIKKYTNWAKMIHFSLVLIEWEEIKTKYFAPSLFSSNEIEIEMDRKILALQNKSEPNTNDFQENGDDSQEILENDPLNDVNSSSPLENEDLPLSTFKIKVCFYIKLLFCWVTDVMFYFFFTSSVIKTR